MRIKCPSCQGAALIRKRRDVTPAFTIFYCVCGDPECGHSFTMEMAFGHTISPSAQDLPERLREGLTACRSPGAARQLLLPLDGSA